MRAAATALLALLIAPPLARAGDVPAPATATPLEIAELELASSRLGPARADRLFYAGERVFVRFRLRGFTGPADDASGGPPPQAPAGARLPPDAPAPARAFQVAIGLAVRSPGAPGGLAPIGVERGPNAFGADAVPFALSFPVGGGVAGGEQELTLEATDVPTGRRVERRERFEVRAPDGLVVLGAYFAADAAGTAERSPVFTVGEDILLDFAVAGLVPRNGKIRGRTDLRIRDGDGRIVSERRGLMNLEAEAKPGVAAVDGAAALTATRAGVFRIEVVETDLNALSSATLERTIEVRSPPSK